MNWQALLYKLTNAFIDLLKVRSIITIIVFVVMSHLAIQAVIDKATFMTVVGAVVTYYFTRKEQ